MPGSIQMTGSQVEAERLSFPKIASRQYIYRYYGVFAGALTDQEIFLDGVTNKRLQIPPFSTAVMRYDMAVYDYTTATGAFAAGAACVGGVIGATNNGGTVAALANPVVTTKIITAQAVAVDVLTGNDTNDCFRVGVTTTGAGTTKVVEIIAVVTIANKGPQIVGAVS